MSESRLTQLQRSISSAILIRTPGGTKEFDPTLCVWGGEKERKREREKRHRFYSIMQFIPVRNVVLKYMRSNVLKICETFLN